MTQFHDVEEDARLAQAEKASHPLEEHLGGRPSPWAVSFFWISVAVAAIAVALMAGYWVGGALSGGH